MRLTETGIKVGVDNAVCAQSTVPSCLCSTPQILTHKCFRACRSDFQSSGPKSTAISYYCLPWEQVTFVVQILLINFIFIALKVYISL